MARSDVIERDLGYVKILAEMAKLDGTYVDVGIHSDAGSTESGMAIAAYAAFNEYGTATIPERSFMRSTFDETVGALNELKRRLVGGVQDGRLTADRAASFLGEFHQRDIQRKIGSNVPPANAPSTIRMKGSSSTLIDTGAMRQAVRYVVYTGSGNVGIKAIIRNIWRLIR